MSPYTLLYDFIHGALSTGLGASLAIVIGTFILEDATLVAVGVMAADSEIPVSLALGSLATGIALGDFGLYGIGKIAAKRPFLRRWVEHEKLRLIRGWLSERLYSTVATTRFLPGMRLPTYLACGFFSVSFRRFALAVMGATIVWSSLVFAAAYFFGVYTLDLLGFWRWPIAIAAVGVLMFVGRAHWRRVAQQSSVRPE